MRSRSPDIWLDPVAGVTFLRQVLYPKLNFSSPHTTPTLNIDFGIKELPANAAQREYG